MDHHAIGVGTGEAGGLEMVVEEKKKEESIVGRTIKRGICVTKYSGYVAARTK